MSPKSKMPAAGRAEPQAAAEPEEDDVEEEAAGSKEKQREGGDVSKLTDYVEQREIDSNRATQAVASIMGGSQTSAKHEAEAAREKDLAAVAVDAADVALIAAEMEMETADAERKLREANGDVVECLSILVSA
jgi:NACalpha-BTF3-like transcription factor